MKKISIICSNYNSDRWIEEYLNIVNNQTNKNFDIIFIDAKSTDNSLQKIKEFNFTHPINKKIIELNYKVGVYEAWNIGIKNCDTEYYMNYNTDDLLSLKAIEIYENYLVNFPFIDIFYGPCGFTDSRKADNFVGWGNWPEYSHEILLQYCLCGPFPLVKTKSAINAGLFNEFFVSSGDYEMWLRMSSKGYKFMKINETVGNFYTRPDSISANKETAQVEDYLIKKRYK